MSTAEERADLKANPLPPAPDCSTCLHCYVPEAECNLRDGEDDKDRCEYLPDDLHDGALPALMQAFLIQEKISSLQEEIKAFQKRYEILIETAVASNIEKEGPYCLIDKKRSVRVPDPVKFRELYPDAYAVIKQEDVDRAMRKIDDLLKADLTSIPVKRAEELVGKIPLTKISDENVYHSYSVQRVVAGGSS